MRAEPELEALLKELQGIVNTDELVKRRLDRSRLIGSIATIAVLEWALGAQGDQTRDSLVKLVKTELAQAVRHANR